MAHGFVSSFLAKQTGFSEDDLELLWQALAQMFEHDHSAARGEMATPILKLQVVAEGVETCEQLEFIRTCGCDAVQGYYFSKPVPVEEISDLLLREEQPNNIQPKALLGTPTQ